jgi:hypothetical protein
MISSTATVNAMDRYDIAIASTSGSRCVPGYKDESAELVRYDLRHGQRDTFVDVQKQIQKAWGDSAPPFSYCWAEIVGRRRSSFILVLPRNRWADSARLEKFFNSILIAKVGKDEATRLMNEFEASVQRRNVTRWDYLAGHAVALTAAMGPSYGMPQFRLPPPKWTSRYVLPAGLVVRDQNETLGDAFDRIVEAFRHADITEWSTYAIGDDGFAVVSRMEHIDDDGRPRPGAERWEVQSVTTSRKFGLAEYLKLLFSAQPGRYRVIVFLVTEQSITSSTTPPTSDDMATTLAGGAGTLSPTMRKVVLRSSSKCEALIYEFYRPSEDDVPQSVGNSTLLTVDHLALAGFWNREELLH